jgi:NADH:ubiquinone oxidoreductase subunit C
MLDDYTANSPFVLICVGSYVDLLESSTYYVASYPQTILETATILKLSSTLNYNTVIDALVIDNLNHEFRFTVLYLLHSSTGNTSCRLLSKVADSMSLLSLHSIFPGFNWSEREI